MTRCERYGSVIFIYVAVLFTTVASARERETVVETDSKPLPEYSVLYDVGIVASEKSAHVTIRLWADAKPIKWIRFKIDPNRYRAIRADGELIEVEGGVEWHPPKGGGRFRYVFSIDHLRNEEGYDARCAKNWAIFRGEDLVPKMRIRTYTPARSKSRMRLRLPEGWSAAIPYRRLSGGDYSIDEPRRRFDRPTGWFALGKMGVVRETIGGARITIAGPARQGIRRMDMLALLKWNLPALGDLFGVLPRRFQIVSAGDPMWRGGLSAPRSIFLHVDRPLIGEDSTSPLLHEMVHSLMRASAGSGGNWVVEGIAELYSIELLRRSQTLTESRYESAVEAIRKRARKGGRLRAGSVTGDTRAKAVVVMWEIDAAIREATSDEKSLDDAVRQLASKSKRITTKRFRSVVADVAGRDLKAIFERYAPEPN